MGDIVSESTGDFISVRLGDFVGIRIQLAKQTGVRRQLVERGPAAVLFQTTGPLLAGVVE
ncbi:hypothetical protein ACVWWO_004698 [Bradyrhizobium sp. F1.13.1]